MSSFTTRVELHDASWDEYEVLHREMRREGFERTITSRDGVTYNLPWAEYDFDADISRADVLNKAKAAATRTKKRFAVLITEAVARTWHGLDRV